MCCRWTLGLCLKKYCGQGCCRCLLITLNIPLSVIGVMVTGVFAYSKMLIGDVTEENAELASPALQSIVSVIVLGIVVGLLVTLSGVMGCCGACCQSRKGILMHLIFLVVVLMLEVATTVALFFIRSVIYTTVKEAELDAFCQFCSQLLTEDSGALQVIAWALVAIIFVHTAMLVASTTFLCILKNTKTADRNKTPIRLTIVHGVPISPAPIPLRTKLPESVSPQFGQTKQFLKSRGCDVTREFGRETKDGGHPLTPLLHPDLEFTFPNEQEKGQFLNPSSSSPALTGSPYRRSAFLGRSSTPTATSASDNSNVSGVVAPSKTSPPSPPPPPPTTPIVAANRPPTVALEEIKRALEARRLRFTY